MVEAADDGGFAIGHDGDFLGDAAEAAQAGVFQRGGQALEGVCVDRLVNSGTPTARCPACGRSVKWLASGTLVAHKVRDERCPGSGGLPAEDPALAAWLPVRQGLTPHGFRHSKKTWMIEDGIPEILAETCLGHLMPGMRGLYSHVSERMRQDLVDALQRRWEESLKVRAGLSPDSAVPVLDKWLAPLRRLDQGGGRNLASQIPPTDTLHADAQVA
jgi:hypothetical protein